MQQERICSVRQIQADSGHTFAVLGGRLSKGLVLGAAAAFGKSGACFCFRALHVCACGHVRMTP